MAVGGCDDQGDAVAVVHKPNTLLVCSPKMTLPKAPSDDAALTTAVAAVAVAAAMALVCAWMTTLASTGKPPLAPG